MKAKWKDCTSWKKSDKDKSVARSWELYAGGERLVVTRHIHYEPDRWVYRDAFGTESPLESKGIDDAKKEAIEKYHDKIQAIIDDIR